MAKGCRDFQSPAGIEPMSSNSLQLALTTKPQVHVCQLRKTIYQSSCLAPLNGFFCVQNYHYRIAQAEYQGQIRHTRILDCEPSINTCYSIGVIGQRLGRNIFSPLKFAHHWVINLGKVNENMTFRTDLRDWVMDGWSVTQLMIIFSSRLLKKSWNRKSKLVQSMQISTWPSMIHLMCCLFGCKLWLQSIQNHARDHFPVLAHCYQKWLGC